MGLTMPGAMLQTWQANTTLYLGFSHGVVQMGGHTLVTEPIRCFPVQQAVLAIAAPLAVSKTPSTAQARLEQINSVLMAAINTTAPICFPLALVIGALLRTLVCSTVIGTIIGRMAATARGSVSLPMDCDLLAARERC